MWRIMQNWFKVEASFHSGTSKYFTQMLLLMMMMMLNNIFKQQKKSAGGTADFHNQIHSNHPQ